MANVIIGVHGLGNKPPARILEKWWMLSMLEGLKINDFTTTIPKFELIYWADIIHDTPLDKSEEDKSSKYYIDERYTTAPEYFQAEDHSKRKKLVDFLGRQMNRIFLNDDLTLNYGFISDAILKRHFSDLEIYYRDCCAMKNGQVRPFNEIIRERLLSRLEKHRNDNIMLIGHSMGSIVAYDVLAFLATDIRVNIFITMGSPLGLPLIISRIASEHRQIYGPVNRLSTPPSVSGAWYNYSDILDMVAFNYKLSDFFSENAYGVKPVDILVVNDYVSEGNHNPHKSFGYLRTTEFSRLLHDFAEAEHLSLGQKIVRKTENIILNVRYRREARMESNKD